MGGGVVNPVVKPQIARKPVLDTTKIPYFRGERDMFHNLCGRV